jgi:chemotaxis protein histidine kinase CheA
VDFAYLEGFAMDDSTVIDEVLALFREQAALWTPMLDKSHPGWKDAVHTVKGAARGVGAFTLGDVCERCEAGQDSLEAVKTALDLVLLDIAAYAHEQALRSLRAEANFGPCRRSEASRAP